MLLPLEGAGESPGLKKRGRPRGEIWNLTEPERKKLVAAKARAYRVAHPDKFKAIYARYRQRHYEKRKAKWRSAESRNARADYTRKWIERNPDKKKQHRQYSVKYNRERYHRDPAFALKTRIRKGMLSAFRRTRNKKPGKTMSLLGCSVSEAKSHIESLFVNGMCWQNPKSFEIDHVIPVSAFDLSNEEEVRFAFNWRNLQPLTRQDNERKRDTLPTPLPSWLPAHVAERVAARAALPARLSS